MRRIATWLLIVATAAVVNAGTPRSADAGAPVAVTIGRLFNDTMDTRLAAQRVAEVAAASGYASSAFVGGRSAANAWNDGQRAAVFGLFGHSNVGIFQTDEGPSDAQDEILGAGTLTTLSATVSATGASDGIVDTSASLGPAHWAYWKDYAPYVDVDDLAIAILAGCFTANADAVYGSFLEVGRQRGMDSIIGFTGLVDFPSGGCVDCNYAGNYFWDRFATYAQLGDTVGVALSKASADLVAKEGRTYGWDGWYVRGAVTTPADVRLVPASRGTPLNSKPFGIDPFQLSNLTTVEARQLTLDGVSYTDIQTLEGVTYRTDPMGQLVWLAAPASTQGDGVVSEQEALDRARSFAEDSVAWLRPSRLALIDRKLARHGDGDKRYEFTWRSLTADVPGPALLTIQVDARRGSIVFVAASEVPSNEEGFGVTEAQAIEAAHALVPGGAVIEVTRDIWRQPRWTVRLQGPPGQFPDITRVTIDGMTGRILPLSKT